MRARGRVLSAVLAALLSAACTTPVLHGLSEQDSNRAIAVLQEQGITASKQVDNAEGGTWMIVVPRGDVVKVWSVLQQYRLPASPGRRFQDVFGKNKLVVAPIEEKALFLEALQGEIGHTLESVSGVVSARVHVAIPEQDLSGQAAKEAKASVMLEYHPDPAGQSPLREDQVQKLVASGVSDLKPDNVSVVMKAIDMAHPEQAYQFTAFGPLVVANDSLVYLKLLGFALAVLMFFLGATYIWQTRVMNELRYQLQAAQRQVRAVQKPPKPTA